MLPQVRLSDVERSKIRTRLGVSGLKKLVTFLGFLTPSVELEWMLASCNPRDHELVIVGEVPRLMPEEPDKYPSLCRKYNWDYQKLFKGYLSDHEAAEILAASDIVFLPFRGGCRESINTSYLAARLQAAYIITTSACRYGYDPSLNTYYVPVGQTEKFSEALTFVPEPYSTSQSGVMTWETLAQMHMNIYSRLFHKRIKSHA